MKKACEAILERCAAGPNRASELGAANGCIYCSARQSDAIKDGDKIVVLNGYNAGERYFIETLPQSGMQVGGSLDRQDDSQSSRLIGVGNALYGKIPLNDPPPWAPPLSLRDTFIIDELAVWMCGDALQTGEFLWAEPDVDECIRTIWEKRIPITSAELVAVLAAHGLPTLYHERLAARYADGIRLLCWTKRRPALKNKRLTSFDNRDLNPKAWFDKYILPGLPVA